jgi:hypothetical protein
MTSEIITPARLVGEREEDVSAALYRFSYRSGLGRRRGIWGVTAIIPEKQLRSEVRLRAWALAHVLVFMGPLSGR